MVAVVDDKNSYLTHTLSRALALKSLGLSDKESVRLLDTTQRAVKAQKARIYSLFEVSEAPHAVHMGFLTGDLEAVSPINNDDTIEIIEGIEPIVIGAANGEKYADIAKRLSIATGTVTDRINAATRALDVPNMAALVTVAHLCELDLQPR